MVKLLLIIIDDQKEEHKFINNNVNTHSCLTSLNRCLSNRVKRILNIISFILSFIVSIVSLIEIFKQFDLMNTIYFFSIEMILTVICIFFNLIMLTSPKKAKAHILYVISLITISVFCINQIITMIQKKYTIPFMISVLCSNIRCWHYAPQQGLVL